MGIDRAQLRKALRAGRAINPRAIEQLVDELTEAETVLARVTGERDRLAEEMAAIEAAIARAPRRSSYVARWAVGVIVGCSVLFALGLGFVVGFAVGGG